MKNLLIFAAGLAPLAIVSSLSTSHLVLGEKEPAKAAANEEAVSPEEAATLAQATQRGVAEERPHVETLLSAVAQPYQFGSQVTFDSPPEDLGELAKSWQGVREGLTICDTAARELAVELPPFTPLQNPPEAPEELKKQIDEHIARTALVNTRATTLAKLKDDLEKSSLEGKDELLELVAKEHQEIVGEKEAIDAAITRLGAAQKTTAETLANDEINQKHYSAAEKNFANADHSAALARLGQMVEPSSAAMMQKAAELKAEIDSTWLEQIRDQVKVMVAAKEFPRALNKIEEYKGGRTEDAKALRQDVTDQVEKENEQFRAAAAQAYRSGDYFGSVDWLLKYYEPKPKAWSDMMQSAMGKAADSLLASTAKVQGFQPNPTLKTLRDDVSRFAAKVNQVPVALRPASASQLLGEQKRIEGTFETVNLLQNLPPKMTIGDWAKNAVTVERNYPDQKIKDELGKSLATVLKAGLSVSKPSKNFESAGRSLVNDLGSRDKWLAFQQMLAKESDSKYNIAKSVVSTVLAPETWPNVEKVLKAN